LDSLSVFVAFLKRNRATAGLCSLRIFSQRGRDGLEYVTDYSWWLLWSCI